MNAHGQAAGFNEAMNLVNEGMIEPRVAYDRAQRKEAFEPFLAAEEGGAA